MRDFTSALYLGMRHPSPALAPWQALTLGKPAALQEAAGARRVAASLARLQGCEAACLLPSTLHLFFDVFGMLAADRLAILADGGSYPVARWAAALAQARGLPLKLFYAGDYLRLQQLVSDFARQERRPLILADGYQPGCDSAPPLARYAQVARQGGGYLLLDDTQVLGILGPQGGGSLRAQGLRGDHILIGASLAKGFGVPLAVLAGSAAMLQRFAACSQTRVHCSPPSAAVLAAARRALDVNAQWGDVLRSRLAARVAQWRGGLAQAGIAYGGGDFPVQRLPGCAGLAGALQAAGVLALGQGQQHGQGALTFLLRADHAPHELEQAMAILKQLHRRRYGRTI